MKCRFCNAPLSIEFVNLSTSPPSNSFLTKETLQKPEKYYPLNVFVCEKCFLVQIPEYKSHSTIFDENYAYFSSFSSTWLKHCKDYVEMITQKLNLDENSQVIEVASNDGYLLQYFKEKSIPCLGIEPSKNVADVAIEKGIETWNRFFGKDLANELIEKKRKADLIIGNNVLAHVPDINDFVSGLSLAITDDGIITLEFPHLLQLIENNQFDTIYHEHFSYLSLFTLLKIFNHHNLKIIDVDEIETHGGSLRLYVAKKQSERFGVSENVSLVLTKERSAGLDKIEAYQSFQQATDLIKDEFLSFLLKAKSDKKRVIAYGAAAKGNTLLNYCEIKNDLIEFVVDASPFKQNKYLPGSRIPVVAEAAIQESKPDFIVIFPWNIKDEIMKQLDYAREWGAKFVIAIPELQIL